MHTTRNRRAAPAISFQTACIRKEHVSEIFLGFFFGTSKAKIFSSKGSTLVICHGNTPIPDPQRSPRPILDYKTSLV